MARLEDFDELDRHIVEHLCASSKGSYRQVAKDLGVHPTTLIQRVKTLEEKGVIRGYRANVDLSAMGFEYSGLIYIIASDVQGVMDELLTIPRVVSVMDVTGEADCVVWITCVDHDEFTRTVKTINSLEGVVRANTSVILNTVKDPYDFVPKLRST